MALDLGGAFNAMMHFAPVAAQAYGGHAQGVNLREREQVEEAERKRKARADIREEGQRQARFDLEKSNQEFLRDQRRRMQSEENQEAEALRLRLGARTATHPDLFMGFDLESAPLATLRRLDERISEAEEDAREHRQARELATVRNARSSDSPGRWISAGNGVIVNTATGETKGVGAAPATDSTTGAPGSFDEAMAAFSVEAAPARGSSAAPFTLPATRVTPGGWFSKGAASAQTGPAQPGSTQAPIELQPTVVRPPTPAQAAWDRLAAQFGREKTIAEIGPRP